MKLTVVLILSGLFLANCFFFWDFQGNRLSLPVRRALVYADSLLNAFGQKNEPLPYTTPIPPDSLVLTGTETVKAGVGVKSVLFDATGAFLYALNLEDMSVMEFERSSRLRSRTLRFSRTVAKGYDYKKHKWINSYEEKPVEGCLTHNGRYLWISLHNAGGVVAWDLEKNDSVEMRIQKSATVYHKGRKKEKVNMRFIETGKTPKVIVSGPNNHYLFVSNWHDNNLAVIDIRSKDPNEWYLMKTIASGVVPRGMVCLPNQKKLVVANMGGGSFSIIDTESMERTQKNVVNPTPRHLLADRKYLYSSFSKDELLSKYDHQTFEHIKSVHTADDPRTIAFSPDSSLIFVTCYSDNKIQAFSADSLKLMGTWASAGKPVGIALWQQKNTIEAWTCNYSSGTIRVFTFNALRNSNTEGEMYAETTIITPAQKP